MHAVEQKIRNARRAGPNSDPPAKQGPRFGNWTFCTLVLYRDRTEVTAAAAADRVSIHFLKGMLLEHIPTNKYTYLVGCTYVALRSHVSWSGPLTTSSILPWPALVVV